MISVVGSKGEKLFVDQVAATKCASSGATSSAADVPVPAVRVPADSAPAYRVLAVPDPADPVPVPGVHGAIPTDGSQCYGFEHEAHEYCSNESVATWVWIRGPAPAWSSVVPAAASAERVVPGAKKLHAAGGRSGVVPVAAALQVAMILSLLFLLLPSVRCRVPTRHAEVAIILSLMPLSLLLNLRYRERRSHSLLELALSLLLRLYLLLLLNVRCRERSHSLLEVASPPDLPVDVPDVAAPIVPDAADVPIPVCSGAHEPCAARNRKHCS